MAINPIRERVGLYMFIAVIIFGVATFGFGISRNFYLSAFWLMVAGGADMISVYVRQSLIQIATPDEMRGRVAAVSTLFISASNEMGEFESGMLARLIGPVNAVVFGGIGAIMAVSYTHLDVYKRQAKHAAAARHWAGRNRQYPEP